MSRQANEIISGKWGRIWINEELWAECKSFEAKVTANYEEVSFCEDLATHQKFVGWAGEGSMTLHKVHSRGGNILGEAFKTGVMPEIKIVSKLSDPGSKGAERVEILDVTFDDFTLIKFEDKSLLEEELSFKFAGYNYLDKIV